MFIQELRLLFNSPICQDEKLPLFQHLIDVLNLVWLLTSKINM